MSFQLTKPSVINIEDARGRARESLLQFTINPYGTSIDTVTGILKNKPKFTIEAEYDRLINMDENFSFLNKIGGAVGIQVGLTKSWTRKIFKGGCYLNIALTARIIQDEYTPDVVAVTKNLVSLCNPRDFFAEKNSKEEVKKQQAKNLIDNDGTLGEVGNLIGGFTNVLTKTPPRCFLSISNYFRMQGFYVKSVSFDFSHEQTEKGPLYSDVDIELTQSEIVAAWELKKAFTFDSSFSI